MKCFTCEKDLGPVSLHAPWQCDDAVMFTTHGNYGSTVYDPFDHRLSLVLNICDRCLVLHKDKVVQLKETRPLPTFEEVPWNPGATEE